MSEESMFTQKGIDSLLLALSGSKSKPKIERPLSKRRLKAFEKKLKKIMKQPLDLKKLDKKLYVSYKESPIRPLIVGSTSDSMAWGCTNDIKLSEAYKYAKENPDWVFDIGETNSIDAHFLAYKLNQSLGRFTADLDICCIVGKVGKIKFEIDEKMTSQQKRSATYANFFNGYITKDDPIFATLDFELETPEEFIEFRNEKYGSFKFIPEIKKEIFFMKVRSCWHMITRKNAHDRDKKRRKMKFISKQSEKKLIASFKEFVPNIAKKITKIFNSETTINVDFYYKTFFDFQYYKDLVILCNVESTKYKVIISLDTKICCEYLSRETLVIDEIFSYDEIKKLSPFFEEFFDMPFGRLKNEAVWQKTLSYRDIKIDCNVPMEQKGIIISYSLKTKQNYYDIEYFIPETFFEKGKFILETK